jgi:kanamycin kinase
MTGEPDFGNVPDFSELAAQHSLGDVAVPPIVRELAAGRPFELVWHNELGGLTFRIDERFVKRNPLRTGIDLSRERVRLQWVSARHPAPHVLDFGYDDDAQWLVTQALPGGHAVGDTWRARRSEAITAIAVGLRAIHAIPIYDFPTAWDELWVYQSPASVGARPALHYPVLVHGDACAPNTLISSDGEWTGNVDFGDPTSESSTTGPSGNSSPECRSRGRRENRDLRSHSCPDSVTRSRTSVNAAKPNRASARKTGEREAWPHL